MKKLSEKVVTLITKAVKTYGTYDPEQIIWYIEEELTIPEYHTVYSFLNYLHTNNLSFGWGNFDEVWKQYKGQS